MTAGLGKEKRTGLGWERGKRVGKKHRCNRGRNLEKKRPLSSCFSRTKFVWENCNAKAS